MVGAGPELTEEVRRKAAEKVPAIAEYPENVKMPGPQEMETVNLGYGPIQRPKALTPQQKAAKEDLAMPASSIVPEAALPALHGFQENINEPLEKVSAAGAKMGGATAEQMVASPEWGPLAPLVSGRQTQEAELARLRKEHPAIAGTSRAVGSVAGGMVADPRMWPFFFAGPEVAPALRAAYGAGFAGQMAHGAVQQASELGKIMDNPDIPQDQKWELGASAVISAIMAGTGGAHLMHDFAALSPADQARIRERIRAQAPEMAAEVDKANARAASAVPTLKPDQVEVQPPAQPQPKAPRMQMPRGASAMPVKSEVTASNLKYATVTLDDGQIIAFDKRKVNADAVREAARAGNLWKMTGEKPPAGAVEAAKQDVRGEEPQPPVIAHPGETQPQPLMFRKNKNSFHGSAASVLTQQAFRRGGRGQYLAPGDVSLGQQMSDWW
jgi:hypothetical protein